MTQDNSSANTPPVEVTPQVQTAVDDAQLLVAYAAERGLSVNPEVLSRIITAKYRIQNHLWSAEAETEFWMASNQMAACIRPVTIHSLRASMGSPSSGRTAASKAVSRVKAVTLVTLVFLLPLHLYWYSGAQALNQLDHLISKSNDLRQKLQNYQILSSQDPDDMGPEQNVQLENAREDLQNVEQQIEAGFAGLKTWNHLWRAMLIRGPIIGKFPELDSQKLDVEISNYQEQITMIEADLSDETLSSDQKAALTRKQAQYNHKIKRLKLKPKEHKARNLFFETKESARIALVALQQFILPLFYGFLGALCFVLRALADRIRDLTYTHECDIKYRLRIVLGGLAGMIAGWLVQSGAVVNSSGMSPFLIALLMGYNVDVLFSMMDRFIAGFASSQEQSDPKAPAPAAPTAQVAVAADQSPAAPAQAAQISTPPQESQPKI